MCLRPYLENDILAGLGMWWLSLISCAPWWTAFVGVGDPQPHTQEGCPGLTHQSLTKATALSVITNHKKISSDTLSIERTVFLYWAQPLLTPYSPNFSYPTDISLLKRSDILLIRSSTTRTLITFTFSYRCICKDRQTNHWSAAGLILISCPSFQLDLR